LPERLVLVSGLPGSGKTTLAGPLAEALGFAMLSKDVIKEQLHDALGDVDPDPSESSRRLGATAMELLWRLAEDQVDVVLEANFRPDAHQKEKVAGLGGRPVEVHCTCPPELALERFANRPDRHPVHAARTFSEDQVPEYGPVALGPVIEVDTTHQVDVHVLAARVRAELG
jgi:predicted kinase